MSVSAQEVLNNALNESGGAVANIWVVLPSGQRASMCVTRDQKHRTEIALFYDKYNAVGQPINVRNDIVRALKCALGAKDDRFSTRRGVRELSRMLGETSDACQQRYLSRLSEGIEKEDFHGFADLLAKKARATEPRGHERQRSQGNSFDTVGEAMQRLVRPSARGRRPKALIGLLLNDPASQANAHIAAAQAIARDPIADDILGD